MGSNYSMGSSPPSRVGASPFLVSNKQVHSNTHRAVSESGGKGGGEGMFAGTKQFEQSNSLPTRQLMAAGQ